MARYGQSKLSRFWYFARVELRPPMPSEFGQVQQGIQKIVQSASTGAWRQLTVKVINRSRSFPSIPIPSFLAIRFEYSRWSRSDVLVLHRRMYRSW